MIFWYIFRQPELALLLASQGTNLGKISMSVNWGHISMSIKSKYVLVPLFGYFAKHRRQLYCDMENCWIDMIWGIFVLQYTLKSDAKNPPITTHMCWVILEHQWETKSCGVHSWIIKSRVSNASWRDLSIFFTTSWSVTLVAPSSCSSLVMSTVLSKYLAQFHHHFSWRDWGGFKEISSLVSLCREILH